MCTFRRQIYCLTALLSVVVASAAEDFHVDIQGDGSYKIQIQGRDWLKSAPVTFRLNGKLYSTVDGSLPLISVKQHGGTDRLGVWSSYDFHFKAGGAEVATSFRCYEGYSMVLFGQEFISGATNCSTGDKDSVISTFPSFYVDKSLAELGYLAYGYIMVGDMGKKLGRWDASTFDMSSGRNSGPMALFDTKGNAVFISSFDNFMAASAVYDNKSATYSWGVMGGVKDVPAGFNYHTIMYYSSQGINQAIGGWGEVMRKYYNKQSYYREADFSNNYLSYWSDNGAFYVNYYAHDGLINNMTYEEAILSIKKYSDGAGIPFRSVQYSVWFEQGKGGGIKAWNASQSLFKDGMRYMYDKTQWVATAHNRWWTVDTPYAIQNGGKYNWIIENGTKYTLPMDERFWEDMFQWSRNWGFICYMQDWMNWQFNEMEATTTTVDIARTWLMQMGLGARQNGITVQYCMAESRHILQSLEIPAVTQARASDDYQPGQIYDKGAQYQWKIGISSMFASAVGLAPFKDTFWSSSVQPDNYYHSSEPYPALQVAVAVLSTGPVGPGDKVGHTDRDVLMRCCAADGLILKPSRPAMAIDAQILQWAFGGVLGPKGEVWTTYTDIGKYRFGIILVAEMRNWFTLRPKHTSFGEKLPSSKLYKFGDDPVHVPLQDFSDEHPLGLTTYCTDVNFCLYYASPALTFQNQTLVLLGETNKYVPLSPQRIRDISNNDLDFNIKVKGQPGEEIRFSYVLGNELKDVICVMSEAGNAVVRLAKNECTSV